MTAPASIPSAGTVIAVRGAVVDVRVSEGLLPEVNTALTVA